MKPSYALRELVVGIKGAGEMASAIACRLHSANIRDILMTETQEPLAVRRRVSLCEAVYEGEQWIEGIRAVLVQDIPSPVSQAW